MEKNTFEKNTFEKNTFEKNTFNDVSTPTFDVETYETVTSVDLNRFKDDISIYLFMFEKSISQEKKMKVLYDMFEYIIKHKNVFEMDKYKGERHSLLLKMIELKQTITDCDIDKYIELLFPDYNSQNNNNDSHSLITSTSTGNSNDNTFMFEDDSDDLVGVYLQIQSSKIKTNLIFDDYELNKFFGKSYNVEFLDAIFQDLANKYKNVDKSLLECMLNENKTPEQIKSDTNYPDGPFIIKMNDNMYELYEKTTTIHSSGYIYGVLYNKTYEIASIKKVGKYGIV